MKKSILMEQRLSVLVDQVENVKATTSSQRPRYPSEIHEEVGNLVELGIKVGALGKVLKINRASIKRWADLYSERRLSKRTRANILKGSGSVRELALIPTSALPPSVEPMRIRFANQTIVEIPLFAVNADLIRSLVFGEEQC